MGIPIDSADREYVVVGLFVATGVPLMTLAMSTMTQLFFSFGDPNATKKAMTSELKASKEE